MTARRRPNTIGADVARAWARGIRLGNPYAKAILMALANYMNEDGTAYPGIETIAGDTDINPDTVLRRQRWLEDIGAIVLSKCWVDENGRRNKEGRGRPTSTEIRFLFDADIEAIEAAAQSDEPKVLRGAAKKSHEEREVSTRPGGEQNSTQEQGVSTPLAPEQPPTGREPPIEESLEREDSPLPPFGGTNTSDQEFKEGEESKPIEGWAEFKSAFEADGSPIVRVSLAKQLVGGLNPDQRVRVARAARGLIAWRSRQRKPHAKPSAQTFIREVDGWEAWEKHAAADPPKPKPTTVFPRGSAEFKALLLCRAIARRPPLKPDAESLTFVGDPPAGAAGMAALVRFNDVTGEVDQSDWDLAPKGSRGFVAWCERVKEWLGFWPEDHRYWLDADNNIVPSVQQAEGYGDRLKLPKCCDGLLLPPLEFPPAKGTGPPNLVPGMLVTQDDRVEFK